jgi:hypothetical protein
MKSISLKVTLKQLAESLLQLSDEELEELEFLLLKDELEKRSKEVKQGKFLRVEEMKSLKNV